MRAFQKGRTIHLSSRIRVLRIVRVQLTRLLVHWPIDLIGILILCAPLAVDFSSAAEADPFKAGERLVYSIHWDPPWYLFFLPAMEAGEIEVQLFGGEEYKGKKAAKIVFKVHSSGSLSKLAGLRVEDEFVFFSEPESLCSISVSKKIHEGKRKRQIDVEYLKESGRLHIRELDESVTPARIKKDEFKNDIPECVQDPLSALYDLRRMKLDSGFARKSILGYDDRIKEVTSSVLNQEDISILSRKLSAWRIETKSLMGGLFKGGGQFRLWLSADEQKMPLQFEVKVKLGRVIGKLKEFP
jgi:hypothetical protein